MTVKTTSFLFVLLACLDLHAQTGLRNSGNLTIHPQGALGIHTDLLINDGVFGEKGGKVGFYGDQGIEVRGNQNPAFNDVEIFVPGGILLLTGIDTYGETHFMEGNITTPKQQADLAYHFMEGADHFGADNLRKIDGYAALMGKQHFVFPVGDMWQLRPLTLNSTDINLLAQCAYFREDPANPGNFPQSFDPTRRPNTVEAISSTEFWHLQGSVTSSIQIGWNTDSNMHSLTDQVNKIIPVGWSISGQSWVNLGTAAITGDLDQGVLTSNNFVPDQYAIITFAVAASPMEVPTATNYLVTPNGDGVNDFLSIVELAQSQDQILRIFDRNGLKVYEEKNYTNGFVGYSNVDNRVINRDQGLPNGLYFYIIDLLDQKRSYQGYLYLERPL